MQHVFDILEDWAARIPRWIEPFYFSVAVACSAVVLEIAVLEHLVIVLQFVYLYYLRNGEVRQLRRRTRAKQGTPEFLLHDRDADQDNPPPEPVMDTPLEGFYGVPYWSMFRDWDRSRWFNGVVHSMWPQLALFLEKRIKEQVDPVLDQTHHFGLTLLKCMYVKMGTVPMIIEAVKCYPVVKNYCTVDFKFRWISNGQVLLRVGTSVFPELDVYVEKFQMSGIMRLRLTVIPVVPIISTMGLMLTAAPATDFDVRVTFTKPKSHGGVDVMSIPMVENITHRIIRDTVIPLIVYPNWFRFAIADQRTMRDWERPYIENPEGVLAVKLISAHNLKIADFPFGLSDPYAVLKVGEGEPQKSHEKWRTLNPVWNQTFAFEVFNRQLQPLHLQLYDADINKDDSLGHLSVKFDLLANNEFQSLAAPLQGVGKGSVQLQLLWVKAYDNITSEELDGLKRTAEILMQRGQVVRPTSAGTLMTFTADSQPPSPTRANGLGIGTRSSSTDSFTRMRTVFGSSSSSSSTSPVLANGGTATTNSSGSSTPPVSPFARTLPVSAIIPGTDNVVTNLRSASSSSSSTLGYISTEQMQEQPVRDGMAENGPFKCDIWKERKGIRKSWVKKHLVVPQGYLQIFSHEGAHRQPKSLPLASLTVHNQGLQRSGSGSQDLALWVMDVFCRDLGSGGMLTTVTSIVPLVRVQHVHLKLGFEKQEHLDKVIAKVLAGGGSSMVPQYSDGAIQLAPGTNVDPIAGNPTTEQNYATPGNNSSSGRP